MGLATLPPAVPPSLAGHQCPCPPRILFRGTVASPYDWWLSRPPPQSLLAARLREKDSRACVNFCTVQIASSSIYAESTATPTAAQMQPSGAAPSFTCATPNIEASCTPSLLFEEPLWPLPTEPSCSPGMDLASRLADDAIIAPTVSTSSVISRTPMFPPTAPIYTAASLSTRSARSALFGLVAHSFGIPCTTWIPHSNRSSFVLRCVICEIKSFPTPLTFIQEGGGCKVPNITGHPT